MTSDHKQMTKQTIFPAYIQRQSLSAASALIKIVNQLRSYNDLYQDLIIVCLSLLTMTNLNHMQEMLLFVCSKMADQTNSSSKLSVADRTTEV